MNSIAENRDCMEAMVEMEDGSFDLCFTDPPYNVGLAYNGYVDKRDDYREWCAARFKEVRRIASCVVFTPGMVNLFDWIEYERPTAVMPWYKPNQCSSSVLRGFNVWEPVLVYGKPKYQIPQDGILEPIALQPDASFHACPKHLKTWQKLMSWFAKGDDRVLDIFLGSGTGRIAASNLGLFFVGYELSLGYFNAQEERFANHLAQPKLFVPDTTPIEQGVLL